MDYQNTILQLKEDRKSEIIKKAIQLFMHRGIYEVSMGEIADYCNVGVASLYRYFGNKNTLVILCGEEIWDTFSTYFSDKSISLDLANQSGIDHLKTIMVIFLDLYKDLSQELCFVHNFDNYVCKQKPTLEELVPYETRVKDFYQFFIQAYHFAIDEKVLTKSPFGEYQFLTVIHVLFVMCQKFAQGQLMSMDSIERSNFELQVIIDLYQHQ